MMEDRTLERLTDGRWFARKWYFCFVCWRIFRNERKALAWLEAK